MDEMFTMTVTVGNIAAWSRPRRSDVSVRSWLASAKRATSWGSRTNARTTLMPVICSRRTRLTASIRSCITWKPGTIWKTIEPSSTEAAGTHTSRTTDRPTSSRSAMITPITIVSGAAIIIVTPITTSSCTCWTSLVIRVMSDGAPKWATSLAE